MSEKLVSIIMPAYKAEKYITESIESVLKQTYQNWELLISDNNSTDKTAQIIHKYAEQDSRIKYLSANQQQGAGYARNFAIEQAKGHFIAFLDSDDRWLPQKLSKHIAFMQKHDLYLSYTSYNTFGESHSLVRNHAEVDYEILLRHNVIGCSTAIYNLEKLGKKYYMPTLRIAEDWSLWCNIVKSSNSKAVMLDEPLTLYRLDENSLSANKLKCAYYHYIALRQQLKVPLFKAWYLFTIYAVVNSRKVLNLKVILRMLGIRSKPGQKSPLKKFLHFLIFNLKEYKLGGSIYKLARYLITFMRFISKQLLNRKFQELLLQNSQNLKSMDIENFTLEGKRYVFIESMYDQRYNQIQTMLGAKLTRKVKRSDFAIIWGHAFKYASYKTLKHAVKYNIPVFIAEDGFLRSIDLGVNGEQALSVQLDLAGGIYYDARTPSVFENALNNKNFVLTAEQKILTQTAMTQIKENALSKYNLIKPQGDIAIGKPGNKKVLVLDQRYGDQSIPAAMATAETFIEMLEAAKAENPNADIILKVHPDAISGGLKGHYKNLANRDDVIVLNQNYNPVSLINAVDKVYTVSSGMGFEALMCGKKVICFGLPFYSGWGLTDDRISIKRRKTKRTLEDLFYVSYIKYSYYYNDIIKQKSDILETIRLLVQKRNA